MRSKRIYPEKSCKNPNCDYGSKFRPHDKRQLFCCPQCGTNYRNDLRSSNLHTIYGENKRLMQNEKILKELYNKYANEKHRQVHISELNLFQYRFDYCINRSKYKDGRIILWTYSFGIVVSPNDSNWFEILKRNNAQNEK